MNNTIYNQYLPDYVSPPGETLEEILEEKGMSQAELSKRTGRHKKTINEIINGKAAITPETALQLERVLGTPASYWNNSEQQYREYLASAQEQKRLENYQSWLKKIPVKDMIKQGWIKPCQDLATQLREILNFFAVASPEQWEEVWGKTLSVDFRKSQTFKSDESYIAAWLRKGQLNAEEIICAEYSANNLRKSLDEIRKLTLKEPEVFQTEMIRLCAESGVALVFVPQLPKTRVSGATYWLNSKKAVIQLSLRYKTNDHFWFAFFHEAAHILLHSKKAIFLEGQNFEDSSKQDKEEEANSFAANLLIPSVRFKRFIESCGQLSKEAIKQFAKEIEIAPGIVVGRLQHQEKLLLPSYCNDLKLIFEWTEDNKIKIK
jgi:addiction module HigA family antidote